jgi:uncharacterized repeat protein (TIGR01451 family)
MSTSLSDRIPAPEEPPGSRPPRRRTFVALVAVLVVLAGGYVVRAAARGTTPPAADGGATLAPGRPALLFQNLAEGDGLGQVAVAPLGVPDGARSLTGLRCDRVHYAGGHGVCLTFGSGFPPVEYAMVFGPDFRVTAEIPLDGLPSRTRVSADGRYGTATVFVTGHSYAQNDFSTSTTLIDMVSGTAPANLEEFTILRDGVPFTAPDVNFWGVTFAADSNRFFATLATGAKTYLVQGDIAARRVVVGRENVECPSLSPDGTRLGFKKRLDDGSGSPVWRFHVLDLASGRETPLAETRSIDDQLEWLDDDTVLYGSPDSAHAVFSVPADGTGEPHQLLSQALSPAVLRTPLPDASVAGLLDGPQVTPASTDVGVAASSPAETAPDEPVVHTLRVTNRGPVDATRVVAEDVVTGPGRIVTATADTPPGTDGYGCAVFAEENRVRCDLPRLPTGTTWTITVAVSPTGPGTVEGRALVGAAEPDPVDDGSATVRTVAG